MRARVAWSIRGTSGHGDWLDVAVVASWVDAMNREYGPGTHRIEFEPAEAVVSRVIDGGRVEVGARPDQRIADLLPPSPVADSGDVGAGVREARS